MRTHERHEHTFHVQDHEHLELVAGVNDERSHTVQCSPTPREHLSQQLLTCMNTSFSSCSHCTDTGTPTSLCICHHIGRYLRTFLTRPPHFLCSYGNFEYPVSKECQTAGQLGCQKLSGNQGCRECADIVQRISLCLCKKAPAGLKPSRSS